MDPQQQFTPLPPSQPQPYQPAVGVPPRRGGLNKTTLVIIVSILAVIFLGLAIWAFMQKQSLQQSYAADVQVEVNKALSEQETRLREDFEKQQVADVVTFDGPDVLGNVQFSYPKTWSVVIDSSETGTERLAATIHPQAITNTTTAFALKVLVLDEQYAEQVESYQSKVDRGDLTSKAVTYAGQDGIRLDGQVDSELTGSIVLLPIRDRTLVLQTESDNFSDAYEQALKTLSFTP